jgi:hypothetical protein
MTTYINAYWNNNRASLETVDEFKTRKEALKMLREYSTADNSGTYYTSQRPCKEWNE